MSRPDNQMETRFIRTLATSLVLLLVCSASVNIYCNPWGNYGETGVKSLVNLRSMKVKYYSRLSPKPPIVVIGSSNTLRYRSEAFEKNLGKKSFNFGVLWGKADDFLCVTSFVLEQEELPEIFVVGVDTWTFRKVKPNPAQNLRFPGIRRRLLNTSELIRHHPEVSWAAIRWSRIEDLFSYQQLRTSLRDLRSGAPRKRAKTLEESLEYMEEDGCKTGWADQFPQSPTYRANVFTRVENDEYPLSQYMREDPQGITGYDFKDFDEKKIDYFRAMLQLAQEKKIKVVLVRNPIQPVFQEIIEERTPHRQNVQRLTELLEAYEAEFPETVLATVDGDRIWSIGGKPDGFYDGWHPATHNSNLVVQLIGEALNR